MHSVNNFQLYFLKIHANITFSSTPRSSEWSLPFRFSNQKFLYISQLPVRVTCSAPIILLDLITVIIFGEEYNLWSSSLCSLLQSPATSTVLNILFCPSRSVWRCSNSICYTAQNCLRFSCVVTIYIDMEYLKALYRHRPWWLRVKVQKNRSDDSPSNRLPTVGGNIQKPALKFCASPRQCLLSSCVQSKVRTACVCRL
jgi:hypothetical protein